MGHWATHAPSLQGIPLWQQAAATQWTVSSKSEQSRIPSRTAYKIGEIINNWQRSLEASTQSTSSQSHVNIGPARGLTGFYKDSCPGGYPTPCLTGPPCSRLTSDVERLREQAESQSHSMVTGQEETATAVQSLHQAQEARIPRLPSRLQ